MRVLFYLGNAGVVGLRARDARRGARPARARPSRSPSPVAPEPASTRSRERSGNRDRRDQDVEAGPPRARSICARCSRIEFIEVAVVSTERDHLIVASAMRAAGRGGVLRRVPSFERVEPAAWRTARAQVGRVGRGRHDPERAGGVAAARLGDPAGGRAARRRCGELRRPSSPCRARQSSASERRDC